MAAESFVIEGGHPLGGRIRAAGNKNGALPILAACLLTDEPVTLANVPRIDDVESMIGLLHGVGAEAEWTGPNEVRVHAAEITSHEADAVLADRIRASFLLAGPLLARLGRASVPPPGGDVIGRRRLDPHLHAFERLGAEITVDERYEMHTDGLRGTQIFLDEASVMATENTVMAAALAPGETTIMNAACEPHVQDLCHFLVSLGARIAGIGSNVLRIAGVDRLHGGEHRIGPEHIEVASFIGLAAVTGADITIEDAAPERPRLDHPGVRAARRPRRARRRLGARAAEPGARDPRRHRRLHAEDRGRPVAGVPGRPHLDRGRGRDAGAGRHPDPREDVREPPRLRRQARLDGRADHLVRPAPRGRDRPVAAATGSACRARTSAPGWRS